MDNRFDEISKAMAAGASRRDILKGLFGGFLASLLALVGIGKPAAAQGASDCAHFCQQYPPHQRAGCVRQ